MRTQLASQRANAEGTCPAVRPRVPAVAPVARRSGVFQQAQLVPGHAVPSQQQSSVPAARRAPQPLNAVQPADAASVNKQSQSDIRGAHWHVHKFGGTCMANADRIRAAAEVMVSTVGPDASTCVVVSAMGSHPSSPVKVTDLILNMIKKASRQDAAFLVDLAALQEKHVETAKQLLGQTPELTQFVAGLMDDITNLKAMLQAMSIGG